MRTLRTTVLGTCAAVITLIGGVIIGSGCGGGAGDAAQTARASSTIISNLGSLFDDPTIAQQFPEFQALEPPVTAQGGERNMMPLDCWPSSIQGSVRRSAHATYAGDVEYASDDLGDELQAAAVMTVAVFEMASPAAAEDAVAQIKRAEQSCATGPSGDDESPKGPDAAVRTWHVPVDDPDNPGLAQIVSTTTAEVDGGTRISRLTVSSFAQGSLLVVTGFTASGLDSCVLAALRSGDAECVRGLDTRADVLNLVMQDAIERTTGLPMPDLDREPVASTPTSGDRTTGRLARPPADRAARVQCPDTIGPHGNLVVSGLTCAEAIRLMRKRVLEGDDSGFACRGRVAGYEESRTRCVSGRRSYEWMTTP